MNSVKTERHIEGKDAASGTGNALHDLVKAFAHTEEFRQIVRALAPEALSIWAGSNGLKKMMAAPARRSVERGFASEGGDASGEEIARIFQDPKFIEKLAEHLPSIMNTFLEAAVSLSGNIADKEGEEASRMAASMLEKLEIEKLGTIITNIARAIARAHETNPALLTETLAPGIGRLVQETDFGQIKETVESSTDDLAALVTLLNEELWQYPAKMICLFSMIPQAVNVILRSLVATAKPINRMPPDLLTDVVLALLADIEGEHVGEAANEFNELVRKIHTGSVLTGDQGAPRFPVEIQRIVGEVLSTLDIELLLKSRGLLSDIKEMSLISFIDMLQMSPELSREFFQNHFGSLVIFLRRWSHKADAFEKLFEPEDIADEFARGMGEIDAQEVARTVSKLCTLFNEVREISPGIIKRTVSQLVQSLDAYEVRETVRWFTEDMVESLSPLAPEIFPPLLRGAADLMEAAERDGGDEYASAMKAFRAALCGKEEQE